MAIAVSWPQPPPVLQLPSRSGAEGPPRPFGAEPPTGGEEPHTARHWALAQNRALLYGPFPAGGLERGVSDGTLLLSEAPEVRQLALTRIRQAGAGIVRIPVDWRTIVDAEPPAGSDLEDPASPAYHFGVLDAAVQSAVANGLQVLLVVSHAPAFAEAPDRWIYAFPGSWAPSPLALEAFAAALARRYDGSFPDPSSPGSTLGAVRLFQAWNEPNLAHYLEPQWIVEGGHWSAFSPVLYRQLLNGFYAGVHSVAPEDEVISAGVAPNGDPVGVGRMAPLPFLRALLCLTRTALSTCTERAHFDVLAFHPLSVGNPDQTAGPSLDVSIADAAKIADLLEEAQRRGTILPAGSKPMWVTELNWESDPPAPGGVPAALQAAWVSRALHRLWVAGVTLVDWQFLVDPYPSLQLATQTGGIVEISRPAGLYQAGAGGELSRAHPKQFLQGFSLPFDPLRLDRAHVRVWALLRAPGQLVELQRWMLQRRGPRVRAHARAWRTIAYIHANDHAILNVVMKLTGAARLRLRSGGLTSAPSTLPASRSYLGDG